jgi:alpha-1,6-mannosyltransferase
MRPVLWAIGLIYAMLLIAPPLLSTDVFTYLSAGRLEVLHGINPYLHGPVVKPEDPVFGWTGLVWCDTPTVYGPVFSLFSAALANSSLAFGLWTLKAVAALSAVACAALTWSIAKAIDRPAIPAMLFVALNPVLLIHGIGGGHNDLLMLAAVLLAVRLAVGSRPAAAGGVLAAAVAIKATAGLVLPFLVIGAGRHVERGSRRAAAGFAAVFVTIGAVGTLIYGFSWLRIPSTIANGVTRNAGELSSIPGMIFGYGRLGELGAPARIVLGVAGLICLILAVRFALKGGERWISGAGFAILAAMVFTSQLHPWYIVLVLPFAALSDDRRVKGGAIALTIAVLLAIPLIRHLSPIGYAWPYGA